MAINEILSVSGRFLSAARDTWNEASVITKTAAIAGSVLIVGGAVVKITRRPPPPPVNREPPPVIHMHDARIKLERVEAEEKGSAHIAVAKVDPSVLIESAESSDDEEFEWFDCRDHFDPPPTVGEKLLASVSRAVHGHLLHDLVMRKAALGELEAKVGRLVQLLLPSDSQPVVKALGKVSVALKPLQATAANLVHDAEHLRAGGELGKIGLWTKVATVVERVQDVLASPGRSPSATAIQQEDWSVDPTWAKKVDLKLISALQDNHSYFMYLWGGIIGAWTKTSVFRVRVPGIRFFIEKLAPVDAEATEFIKFMEIKRWAAEHHRKKTLDAEFSKCSESWEKILRAWQARWQNEALLGYDKLVAETVAREPETVKEVHQALFSLALSLFDAMMSTLYKYSEHEIFDLFWNTRAELASEASEGRSERLTAIVKQAVKMADEGAALPSLAPIAQAMASLVKSLTNGNDLVTIPEMLETLTSQLEAEK